eukprot:TRINITY_DN10669_c0_g1_i1.p1 TRINITY_DN10669_c0_g1~~TRINITY_DN10669_c0_g1_i1.p1  ORF type:complete len:704 (-),score=131.35 TRINITY_DN10669_c0_g1_i1:628-2739(-)
MASAHRQRQSHLINHFEDDDDLFNGDSSPFDELQELSNTIRVTLGSASQQTAKQAWSEPKPQSSKPSSKATHKAISPKKSIGGEEVDKGMKKSPQKSKRLPDNASSHRRTLEEQGQNVPDMDTGTPTSFAKVSELIQINRHLTDLARQGVDMANDFGESKSVSVATPSVPGTPHQDSSSQISYDDRRRPLQTGAQSVKPSPSESKAVLAALQSLQDKVQKLEQEREFYQKSYEQMVHHSTQDTQPDTTPPYELGQDMWRANRSLTQPLKEAGHLNYPMKSDTADHDREKFHPRDLFQQSLTRKTELELHSEREDGKLQHLDPYAPGNSQRGDNQMGKRAHHYPYAEINHEHKTLEHHPRAPSPPALHRDELFPVDMMRMASKQPAGYQRAEIPKDIHRTTELQFHSSQHRLPSTAHHIQANDRFRNPPHLKVDNIAQPMKPEKTSLTVMERQLEHMRVVAQQAQTEKMEAQARILALEKELQKLSVAYNSGQKVTTGLQTDQSTSDSGSSSDSEAERRILEMEHQVNVERYLRESVEDDKRKTEASLKKVLDINTNLLQKAVPGFQPIQQSPKKKKAKTKRASSRRKGRSQKSPANTRVVLHDAPFIAGSTTKESHSLHVNAQQVLGKLRAPESTFREVSSRMTDAATTDVLGGGLEKPKKPRPPRFGGPTDDYAEEYLEDLMASLSQELKMLNACVYPNQMR